ncbi:MAG: DNA-3-methyladenine glycosylase [Anaerolineales bacterium]|nr:DNA-3-methyladenine glycosylase [Anaerolineales bacterium]
MSTRERLDRPFFARSTLNVAIELLGQHLVRIDEDGVRLSGMIIETEAYVGVEDLGCHAHSGRTKRNAIMWGPPGIAYVYFTYGMHWMLNMVTEEDGFPAAVLLRGILPIDGLERIRSRRLVRSSKDLTNGPAKICQALGIDGQFNGHDVCGPESVLFIERGLDVDESLVTLSPRVGLNSVPEPWKSIPWRFQVDPESTKN